MREKEARIDFQINFLFLKLNFQMHIFYDKVVDVCGAKISPLGNSV